ncbi:hypothetical protein R6Q57_010134, partial [Mikania cordata]
FYTPNVGSPSKPRVGMVFHILDKEFIFYQKYAKLAGFTVRKTTENSIHGILTKKYFVYLKEGKKTSHQIALLMLVMLLLRSVMIEGIELLKILD